MKVERGTFIGPRAPFGYQKSEANHDQLVPDPFASITVRKIFDLAANGTGVTGIVRYLNEKGLPTPIQYARSNGLTGSFADGTGDWNSRSVNGVHIDVIQVVTTVTCSANLTVDFLLFFQLPQQFFVSAK